MKTQITYDRNLSDDDLELVRILGWRSGLALGIPATITTPIRFEPINHAESCGFEEMVANELHHLIYHAGPEVIKLVQVECGFESWREEDRKRMLHQRFSLPEWKKTYFKKRIGHYVGRTIYDIPVVVVRDNDKPVLRPRWPETNRLVQGG